MSQTDLTDIYRAFHLKAAECTLFSSEHGTLSQINHRLVREAGLGKFEKIEIISSVFSNHIIRLEINYKEKKKITCRLYNMLLNNQCGMYVDIELIHTVVQQKLTQHCKAIILQLLKN